jgi:starch phosphorylase
VGVDAQVFHSNEGHAGFLGLERIRQMVTSQGLSFPEAIEAVRAACIFTTHTPVPAGIDRFPRELMEKYFGGWCHDVGISFDELMTLGHRPTERTGSEERFNMAVMGLRLAGRSNAVSQLHGQVSREMFSDLWPELPTEEVPIGAVTNGVHAHTWTSPEIDDVLTRYVRPEWYEAEAEQWSLLADAPDDELWRAHEQGRERLVTFARRRLAAASLAGGAPGPKRLPRNHTGGVGSESGAAWVDEALDPRILTIGFARRFATYKRANLLLSQPERLRSLLLSDERPVQFVFAGKAHPADEAGKEMIRQIVAAAGELEVRHRFVFIDDYDIAVARVFYHGCDVWLNNPRRPQEACGTSGMKAALNGALNLSILDGWWDEMFDGDNGWAIRSAEPVDDLAHRDQLEAGSLFDLLEHQVVPLYYERPDGPVPHAWVAKMRHSLVTLGPQVSAARMVRDYVEELYEPTASRADALGADGLAKARALAGWKQRVRDVWHKVHVERVEAEVTVADLGAERRVEAVVALGDLSPGDVDVQLLHGSVGQGDELTERAVASMHPAGAVDDHHARYEGSFVTQHAGRYGFTVRVVPQHADLVDSAELGLAAWA